VKCIVGGVTLGRVLYARCNRLRYPRALRLDREGDRAVLQARCRGAMDGRRRLPLAIVGRTADDHSRVYTKSGERARCRDFSAITSVSRPDGSSACFGLNEATGRRIQLELNEAAVALVAETVYEKRGEFLRQGGGSVAAFTTFALEFPSCAVPIRLPRQQSFQRSESDRLSSPLISAAAAAAPQNPRESGVGPSRDHINC
jgi:hypothetical protein